MWENIVPISAIIVASCIGYMILFWFIDYFLNAYAYQQWQLKCRCTWQYFVALSVKERYLYISYITSTINAFGCLYFFATGFTHCDPPKEHRRDDVFLGNTYLRNEWCVDNPNMYEILGVQYFNGYLIWDLYVCCMLIGDFKSAAAQQNFLHHAIGILGSIGCLIVGRYITVLSTASMINELSTPFINLRWFLATHKNTGGVVYLINGLTFTFLFFVCRNIFQTWLVLFRLFPACMRDRFAVDDKPIITVTVWFLLLMYMMLTFLNFFWFYKMFTGCLKQLKKRGAKKETTDSTENNKVK